MLLNSEPPASPNPKSPMLNELSPAIGWSPGMPMLALALPIPAQSTGIVWNFTCVKPTSSSFRAVGENVRFQLNASPRNGELFVEIRLLSNGARSGSDLYCWYDTRPKNRSLSDEFQS